MQALVMPLGSEAFLGPRTGGVLVDLENLRTTSKSLPFFQCSADARECVQCASHWRNCGGRPARLRHRTAASDGRSTMAVFQE